MKPVQLQLLTLATITGAVGPAFLWKIPRVQLINSSVFGLLDHVLQFKINPFVCRSQWDKLHT